MLISSAAVATALPGGFVGPVSDRSLTAFPSVTLASFSSIKTALFDWIEANRTLLGWIGASSLLVLLATMIIVPWMIARLPEDYFLEEDRHAGWWADRHPAIRISAIVAKNILGWILFLTGLSMVLLPGQGLLTMAVGVMLMDFPGKRELELAIIRRKPIRRAVDWIRRKAGRPPLKLPP